MEKTKKQLVIIDKAKAVFLEKGLFETVMDDIAEATGLTRRTLYRHFATKEDLACEVTIAIMTMWNTYGLEIYEALEGNGLQQLSEFLNKLIDYMVERDEIMRYLGAFDFYFKENDFSGELLDHKADYEAVIGDSDTLIMKLIQKGIADGSIMTDMDTDLLEATISNVLWGFGQRIAIRGETIKRETGRTGIELIRAQVAIYIKALGGTNEADRIT